MQDVCTSFAFGALRLFAVSTCTRCITCFVRYLVIYLERATSSKRERSFILVHLSSVPEHES